MKVKCKRIASSLVIILLFIVFSVSCFATIMNYAINVPAWQGHITCASAYKETSATNLEHQVTDMGGSYTALKARAFNKSWTYVAVSLAGTVNFK